MPAATVTVRCTRCGQSWEVAARPDGTLPKTARCAQYRGGCGHVLKVPRAASTAAVVPAAPWNPPSEPRQYRQVNEPCPHCSEAKVYAEPRGTIRACLGCNKRVTPPGVLAPYERGAGVTRAAKSQHERDLEALDLAGRKGIILGRLRALADDDRLDPASALQAEWFAEQVKAAASGARLDELAALFGEAGIRRGYAVYGDDDQDGELPAAPPALCAIGAAPEMTPDAALGHLGWRLAPSDSCQVVEHGAACGAEQRFSVQTAGGVLAWICTVHNNQLTGLISRRNRRMTWAEAIAACGWRLSPTVGGCQIIELGRLCGAETMHSIGSGWVCALHYGTLGQVIWDHHRQQQRSA